MPHRNTTTEGYRYEWSLFTDWCAALDVTPLPASPVTVADFLGDNPAGDTVQIRRVSAINRAHVDAGHLAPGTVTAIRLALSHSRRRRRDELAEQLASAAAVLPTIGSIEALFGRRDALLLMLAAAGLSYRAIAALDRTDITVDVGDSVWIGGAHRIRLDDDNDNAGGFRPVDVWRRWDTVLRFADRYSSTTLVLDHLRANTFPDTTRWPESRCPVAVPIDRWGHMPFPADAMSPAAIADIIDAHRAGEPPRRSSVSRRPRPGVDDLDVAIPAAHEHDQVELGQDYYQHGIHARRSAHTLLTEVPGLYDDVEDRIEQLLARTLHLLEQHTTDPSDRSH